MRFDGFRVRAALVAAWLLSLIHLAASTAAPVHADTPIGALPQILSQVGFDQRLGEAVPRDLVFRDSAGEPVQLNDLLQGRPVILTLNYFKCENICPVILDGLTETMLKLPFTVGVDYDIVSISIDPREKPPIAAEAKARQVRHYAHDGAASAWRFLTGDPAAIDRLTKAVGYRAVYDDKQDEWAHPAGILVLTADGRISRYLYGLEYSPKDVRLALVEASENKIGTTIDKILLFCYRYDPTVGKYSAIALNSMRLGGVVTMLGIAAFWLIMWRHGGRQGTG